MWPACMAAGNVPSGVCGEQLFAMGNMLEEMARQDGKDKFHWNSPRLARVLFGLRRQLKEMHPHSKEIAWIEARIDVTRESELLPDDVRLERVRPVLARPLDHIFAGNNVE